MASRDTLRIIAPELATVADETLDAWLTFAAARISATAWGDLYEQAACYLAAHLYTVSQRSASGESGAGAVVGRKAGDLEIRYGAVVGVLSSDATLATTPYGVEFLSLRKLLPTAAAIY